MKIYKPSKLSLLPMLVLLLLASSKLYATDICEDKSSFVKDEYRQFSTDTRVVCVYNMARGDANLRASAICPAGSKFIHGGYSISNSPYRVEIKSKDLSELPNTRWKHSVRFSRDPSDVGSPVQVQVSAVCSGLHERPPVKEKSILKCQINTDGVFSKKYGDIPAGTPIGADFNFSVDLSKDLYSPGTAGYYDPTENSESKTKVKMPSYIATPIAGGEPKTIPVRIPA